jgi:hypothetical protein
MHDHAGEVVERQGVVRLEDVGIALENQHLTVELGGTGGDPVDDRLQRTPRGKL